MNIQLIHSLIYLQATENVYHFDDDAPPHLQQVDEEIQQLRQEVGETEFWSTVELVLLDSSRTTLVQGDTMLHLELTESAQKHYKSRTYTCLI